MLRSARLLIAVVVMCGAQASGSGTTQLEAVAADGRILAFGDSLTYGVGGSTETYPGRLALIIKREVINSGVPGETTAEGRLRLSNELKAGRPALLILCLGINDFLKQVPAERIRDNLLAMLAIAHAQHVPVLLLAIPRPGRATAEPLFAEAAAAGRAVLDTRSMVHALSHPALKADLVHPNRDGYRDIAESIARTLIAAGAIDTR